MRPRGRRGRVHLSDLGSFWNDRTCFRASAPRPRLTAAMWRGCPGGGGREGGTEVADVTERGTRKAAQGPALEGGEGDRTAAGTGSLLGTGERSSLTYRRRPEGRGCHTVTLRLPQAMLRPQPQLAALWPQCGEWPPGGTRASEMPGQPKEEEGALGREGRVRGRGAGPATSAEGWGFRERAGALGRLAQRWEGPA